MVDKTLKPGTVVFLKNFPLNSASFAVVFEEKFWQKCAEKENKGWVDLNFGFFSPILIPLRILGTKVSDLRIIDDIEPDDSHVVHYVYLGLDDYISSVDIDFVLDFCGMAQRFFSDSDASYFNQVIFDLEVLKKYFSGNYVLSSSDIGSYEKKLLQLFEKGIPKE